MTFLETVDAIGKSDFNNILKMIFAICCSSELINIFYRIYRMILDSWELIVLLLVTLFISASFFRVVYYGIELDQDGSFIYKYSFTSIWRSLESVLLTMTGMNFPDFIINSNKYHFLYAVLIFVFNFIAGTFIFGFFAGGIGGYYMEYYTISLRKLAAKYPEVIEKIDGELEAKYYDPESYDRVKSSLITQGTQGDQRNPAALKSGMRKFRRAIAKLRTLKNLKNNKNS